LKEDWARAVMSHRPVLLQICFSIKALPQDFSFFLVATKLNMMEKVLKNKWYLCFTVGLLCAFSCSKKHHTSTLDSTVHAQKVYERDSMMISYYEVDSKYIQKMYNQMIDTLEYLINCNYLELIDIEFKNIKGTLVVEFTDLHINKNSGLPLFSKHIKSICSFKINGTSYYMDEEQLKAPMFDSVLFKNKGYIYNDVSYRSECLTKYNSKNEDSYILILFRYQYDGGNSPVLLSSSVYHDIGDEIWEERK